uniref:Uncharacterized protein n=1 Tax=Moniliophthora roreri TaxID=221103 RepID=A0A0W0G989_MONRR
MEPQPPRIQLTVWDDEEEEDEEGEEDDRDLLLIRTSNNPMTWPMAWMDEEPTALLTVETTVVRFAENLWLGIYLETATNNNGLAELRDQTIPSAIELLTLILQDLTTMTTFMETVSSEGHDNGSPEGQMQFIEGRDMYVLDDEGTRILPAELVGEWVQRGIITSNLEVRA